MSGDPSSFSSIGGCNEAISGSVRCFTQMVSKEYHWDGYLFVLIDGCCLCECDSMRCWNVLFHDSKDMWLE